MTQIVINYLKTCSKRSSNCILARSRSKNGFSASDLSEKSRKAKERRRQNSRSCFLLRLVIKFERMSDSCVFVNVQAEAFVKSGRGRGMIMLLLALYVADIIIYECCGTIIGSVWQLKI